MISPVILAGGSGTRLWPLSRTHYPKQFLTLDGDKTMLQQTLLRLDGLVHEPALIICNEQHRFIAAEQIRQIHSRHRGILLEPSGRNTAPAIALAAIKAIADAAATNSSQTSDPILLVLSADHVITDKLAFQKGVNQALKHAQQGKLVTFGVTATTPETAYGYIKRGHIIRDNLNHSNGSENVAYEISEFVEKPTLAIAEQFLDEGLHYWNSGIFMFKASRYLAALQTFRPDILKKCQQAMQDERTDGDFIRVDVEKFSACASESIDYAIMEPLCKEAKTDAVVIPLQTHWSDIGNFDALWQHSGPNSDGNVLQGDVSAVETKNSLVISQEKLTVTLGVENLVVITTKDAVLIANKNDPHSIKKLVEQLIAQGRHEPDRHREVYRPWGKYDLIDTGNRFQVKRITVAPGAKLSLQMHYHRAEHWVIVCGVAKVTNAGQSRLLSENESAYIPLGSIHALENPGLTPLELIEIQTGSYLGEDDIVRFEDDYGRVQ